MVDVTDPSSESQNQKKVGWWIKLGAITAFTVAMTGLIGQATGLWDTLFAGDPPTTTAITQGTTSTTNELTTTSQRETTPTTQVPELTLFEQVAGGWELSNWLEAERPIQIGYDPLNGTLSMSEQGGADWEMDIDDRFLESPDGHLTCAGTLSLAGELQGSVTETRNFTSNMVSNRRDILLAFCGGGVFDEFDSFQITHDGSGSKPATILEMENSRGRFIWTRQSS